MIRDCCFVLVGLLVAPCAVIGAPAENAGRPPKPNILFILSDDHASHAVSA